MDYIFNIFPLSVMLLLSIGNFVISHKKYNDIRVDIINSLLLFEITANFLVPYVYGTIEDFPWEYHYGISSENLFYVYMIDLMYLAFWLTGFHAFRPAYDYLSKSKIIPRVKNGLQNNVFGYMLFASILITLVEFNNISPFGQFDPYDSAQLYQDRLMIVPLLDIPLSQEIWTVLRGLFFIPGYIAAAFIVTQHRPGGTSAPKILGWAMFLLLFIYGFVTSVRSFLFGMVVVLIIFALINNYKRLINIIAIGGLLVFFFSPILGGVNREMLMRSDMNYTITERLSLLLENSQDIEEAPNRFWHELGGRMNNALLSTGLVKARLRGDGAGINPVASAIVSPVPRYLWPDKPAPGSSDGTHAGISAFVVWKETIGRVFGLSGGFTAGSHAYWELGFIGIAMWGILSGLFIRGSYEITKTAGEVGVFFWLLSLNPLHFSVTTNIPGIIMMLLQKILPLLILLKVMVRR